MVQALTHFWNDKVVLKLGISNAYNSVSRTAIMEAVAARIIAFDFEPASVFDFPQHKLCV
jgi:hypothetical protein